ncbi:MAG: hypothetical protein A2176_10475 [Spirochaetes bacterium RBG_13_51_14]|nr:MAG: hypothetical protein A2176_10475 [Spirochaetes bacterium RBG_13_51_14]
MVIDLLRCVGCEACSVSCKVENNVPNGNYERDGRSILWNRVITEERGDHPNVKRTYWARPCFHCENPSCVKACPVKATYKDEERGLVLQDYGKCIGCKSCMAACPYGVRSFNWRKPSGTNISEGALNPDVEGRYAGVVEKCTFCIHKIRAAEEKARKENRKIKDGEIVPACVLTCMGKARFFGDLNDPESTVSKLARTNRSFTLKEHLGHNPKVFWLKSI